MAYRIILVKPYKYEFLNITTIAELIATISSFTTTDISLVIKHTNVYGVVYYTDLLTLMSEVKLSTLPATLAELAPTLTDIQFDGYKVDNPIKAYSNKLISHKLDELISMTAQLVNIDQPDNRSPLYLGQDRYRDIVFTPVGNTDISNIIFVRDGKICPSLVFDDELYVQNVAIGLDNTNHTILDLNYIGGCDIYYIKELTKTHHEHKYTTVQLPPSQTFTNMPFIVVEGILYDLTNPHFHIINQDTLQINNDFIGIDPPGKRPEYTEVADVDYPLHRLTEMLSADNSMIVIPKHKIYTSKITLSMLDENMYMYKSLDPYLSGIVLSAHDNSIIPFKVVTSKPHINNQMYTHLIVTRDVPRSLSMDELMLDPQSRLYLDRPYSQSKRDIRLITVSI